MGKKSKEAKKKNNNTKPRGSAGLQEQTHAGPSKDMPINARPNEPLPISIARNAKVPSGKETGNRKPFDKKPSEARRDKESTQREAPDRNRRPFKSLPERGISGKKTKPEGAGSAKGQIKAGRKGNILRRAMRKALQLGSLVAAFGIGKLTAQLTGRGKGARIAALGALAALLIVILAGMIYFLMRDNAFSILVNGEQVAIIRMGSEDISEELKNQAILRIENRLGTRILINEEIEFVPIRANTRYHQPVDEAIFSIGEALTYSVEAVAISVMGTRMTTLRSQYEADRVLSSLKEPHLSPGVTFAETGFVEDVVTTTVYVEEETLNNIDIALQILTSTLETAEDYTVVLGDSLGIIAARANMSLGELLQINPNIDPAVPIRPGDVIRLNIDRPLISVRTVEERHFTTEIEPPVEYIFNPQLRTTQRRTVQHGTLGQANITEHVIRINSMEYSRVEVERIITVTPQAEIIEVGTG